MSGVGLAILKHAPGDCGDPACCTPGVEDFMRCGCPAVCEALDPCIGLDPCRCPCPHEDAP